MSNLTSYGEGAVSPSSIPSIHNLPSYWRVIQLGNIAKVKYGKAKPKDTGDVPVVGSGGVYGWTSKALVDFPTLVIGRKGTAGMVWLQERQCWPSDTTFYLEWKTDEIDYRFLYHSLQERPLSGEHARTTMPSLLRSDLEAYTFPLPPLPEQRAIAHALRAVQEAKEARQREMALERERKAALMQHLFTHGIRGESRKQTEIGEIPKSWRILQLGELIDMKNGINFSAKQKGRGILTVDVLNMYSDSIYIKPERLYRIDVQVNDEYLLKPNDILFVRSSLKQEGVGWPALFSGHIEPMTFCGFLIRARLIVEDMEPKFLINYLRLPSIRRLLVSKSGKVAITNVNQASIRDLPVPIPSIPEQSEIVDVLSACDAKIAALEQERGILDELFRSMLEELMTGRLSAVPLIAESKEP